MIRPQHHELPQARLASPPKFLLLVAVALHLLGTPLVHAQPVQVERYDDANEYLPIAQSRNRDKVRLFLRQQDNETLFKAASPRNVTVNVVAHVPANAKYGVVMLLGGTGVLSIAGDKLDRSFSFQPRSRDHWWSHNVATFLVDAPSDRLGRDGIGDAFWRGGADHRTDLAAVLDAIGKRYPGPLVIHGHSLGAFSTANLATLQNTNVKAFVYTGAAHDQRNTGILGEAEHKAPVIVVQHRDDTCRSSNTRRLNAFTDKLRAPAKAVIVVDGGSDALSGVCGPFAPHSFFGMEKRVIDRIAGELGKME